MFEGKTFYTEMTPAKAIGIAMSLGLSWSATSTIVDLRLTRPVKRRHGFPSWSWCGWISYPTWPPWVEDRHFVSPPNQFQAQKKDGSRFELNEDLADQLFFDDSLSSQFTYNLCIRAEISDIALVYLTKPIEVGPAYQSPQTRYAAKAVGNARPEDRDSEEIEKGILLWPMQPTLDIEESDELHTTLLTQNLQCIGLTIEEGLVVQEMKDGIFERVGLIRLESLTSDRRHDGPLLRKHFPSSVRDIVLG